MIHTSHTKPDIKIRPILYVPIIGRSPNGPVELRLSAVRPIRGRVFGSFGEILKEARKLVCYTADATAAPRTVGALHAGLCR